jgi:hypothetical protein
MEDRITLQKMEQERRQIFLGCDAHRKYSVFVTVDEREKASVPVRVEHDRPAFRRFLRGLQLGTPVALEATGSWYWLVDEMEEAGLIAHLAQPFARGGCWEQDPTGSKKTDAVDARCLATLLRNGTLPETWIPPADLRDFAQSHAQSLSAAPISDVPEEPHCGGMQSLWSARAGGRR